MSFGKIEKYPYVSLSKSLKGMWSNDDFPFACMKASRVIALILSQKMNFREFLELLGMIRRLLEPNILNPQNRSNDLDSHQKWLVSFIYQQAESNKENVNFYTRWINVYKKYEPHFIGSNFGVCRWTQANTPVFNKSHYEEMIEELDSRFAKQSNTNVLNIKCQEGELAYSLINRISNEGYFIQHTPPASFYIAERILSELLNKILCNQDYCKNENNFSILIKNIAFFNWHLSQAMFFERGSATISELLTTALFIYKGIPLPEYKKIVTCDLLAIFSSSPELFANEFPTFFNWPDLSSIVSSQVNNQYASP